MRIYDVKINGVKNPIGYDLSGIVCSWKVSDAKDPVQKNAVIKVYDTPELTEPVYITQGNFPLPHAVLDFSPAPCTRYWYTVEVYSENDYGLSTINFFESGKCSEPWTGAFIGTSEDADSRSVIFSKEFNLEKDIKSARLYVCGLGVYEAMINGNKIGDEYMAPFCTDYRARIQYQTYDVTAELSADNRIEILCGSGWYKGRLGYSGDKAFFSDRYSCIAELSVEFTDGTRRKIVTDDSWCYEFSQIVSDDIYDGEHIDGLFVPDKKKNAVLTGMSTELLKERLSLSLRVKETLPVKQVIISDIGETILDFGQNCAGFVSFVNRLPAGEKISLQYGEILQNGRFYNENLRSAKAEFSYISDGAETTVRPHFTYYGFRYVKVVSPVEVNAGDFTANILYSDLDTVISFKSSNPMLNRLFLNVLWGQKSNFTDIPTDCPQRDERLGWTGDANVFSGTATYNMDTAAFYRKYLTDLRDDQLRCGGRVANFVPNWENAGGACVWGDVAVFMPVKLYEHYGDVTRLAESYLMMKDWVDYIIRLDRDHGDRGLWDFGFQFGDWVALDGVTDQSVKGGTDDGYVASMYYYEDCVLISETAAILGKNADSDFYADRAEKIKAAILAEYFSPSGRLAIDTQTGYILSLRFGVYVDKAKIVRGFISRLTRDGMRIRCGFVGATCMLNILAENGLGKIAEYLLLNENYPGWMHCIKLGATTVWERWNSVLEDGSISGTGMNSLNHYSYGSVMEYVYRYVAGIRPALPGFKKAIIQPHPSARLKELNLEYDSPAGKYVSHCRLNGDGTVFIHAQAPFNAEAELYLPGTDKKIILRGETYEDTYTPDEDLLIRYSSGTFLAETLHDPEALSVYSELFPSLDTANPEYAGLRIGDIKYMPFLGISPEAAADAEKQLLSLRG